MQYAEEDYFSSLSNYLFLSLSLVILSLFVSLSTVRVALSVAPSSLLLLLSLSLYPFLPLRSLTCHSAVVLPQSKPRRHHHADSSDPRQQARRPERCRYSSFR